MCTMLGSFEMALLLTMSLHMFRAALCLCFKLQHVAPCRSARTTNYHKMILGIICTMLRQRGV